MAGGKTLKPVDVIERRHQRGYLGRRGAVSTTARKPFQARHWGCRS